jgi:hypothetical protein
MKIYGTLMVLTTFNAAIAGAACAADVAGQWQAEFTSPIGRLKYIYDLKTDGDKLAGKAVRELEGEKTETELKEGKLSGNEVSFVELLKFNDQDIRIEYKGRLDGDEIKFTRKVGDFATMEIVAKRVKPSDENTGTKPPPYGATASRLKLKVVKVDSEETAGEDGKGANAVDGDASTFWHTQWQDTSPNHPHEIIIELSAPASIKGFTYLPRQDDQVNGTIKDYEFYLSNDGKDFGQPVKKGTLGEGKERKTVTFDAKQARFIKLKALSEINDQAWTSAAEIGLIQN